MSSRALAPALDAALHRDDLADVADAEPISRRDRLATLSLIYALHTAPLDRVGERARFQHHPVVAELKSRLEADWLGELDAAVHADQAYACDDVVAALRSLAARDRLPQVYKWLASDAQWSELVHFLTLEGGPDAGFDDLVAYCQVGLGGRAKLELATNYWDEMGNGRDDDVHTVLHDRLVDAVGVEAIPLEQQPESGLARTALGGLLATNRWLQPEMLGALGLIELQAGPRCRLVLQAFDRLGAPRAAYPFYEVHAEVDPRHGRDWLDKAVAPMVVEQPEWGPRIVRGALWRSAVNAAFFADVTQTLLPASEVAA